MRLPHTRLKPQSLAIGTVIVLGVIVLFAIGFRHLAAGPADEKALLQFHDAKLAARSLVAEKGGGDRLLHVSMIQLIANPERYHNQPVRLSGFLHVHFEGTGVYLTQEDADYLISRNGLWVSFDSGDWSGQGMNPRQFDRKHVLIEGVFDKYDHGHKGAWSGAIHTVWRVMQERKYHDD